MATQVKFYDVSSLPSTASNGALYFVQNGELYKGSQRFGLGRVTVDAQFNPSTSSKDGQARGDVVVTGAGAGWVFDGTNWQSIGGDIAALTSAWRADISTWTAGLVQSGEGSYITGITQAADGKVTASASNFATDVLETVGDGSSTSTANGITVDVVTTSGKVTGVSVAADNITASSVTASAATFGDLTVSGTASFNATTVNASTMTVEGSASIGSLAVGSAVTDFTVAGSTIPDYISNAVGALATSTVTASGNGIVVGVTTQSGSVTAVSVSASAITCEAGTFTNLTVTDTATFSATSVAADSLTIGGSTVEQLADKQIAAISSVTQTSASNGITVSVTTQGGSVTAVSLDASAFGNAIHFRGVEASTADVSDPVAGDIVVIGAEPTGGAVAGQEYIYNGTSWELIGDQNTYALNAYSSTASVYTGVQTVPGALNAVGAAVDTLTSKTNAYVGGTSTSTVDGVTVSVSINASTMAPSVDVGVVAASTMGFGASGTTTELATTKAVADYFENNLVWLGADGQPVDDTPAPTTHADTWYKYAGDTEWRTVSISGSISGIDEMTPTTQIPNVGNVVALEIGTDVTSIGDNAFPNCNKLTSVTIPNSVTSIGNWTFMNCNKLTSVTIPNSVTSVGNAAFYGCTGLTSVTISNSAQSIGIEALHGCSNLRSITIPSSVASIGTAAFNWCNELTNVTFLGKTLEQVQAMDEYSWGIDDTSIINVA